MSEQHVIIIPSNNDDDFTITGDLFADLDHGEDGTDTDDDHDIVEVVPVPQACKHKEPSRTLAPAEVVTVALSGTGETAILSNNGMLALWRLCTDGNDQPAKVWTAPIKIPLTDEPLLRLRKKTHLSLSRGAQYVAVTYTYSDSRKYTFDILAVSTSESVPIFEKGKNCAAGFVGEDMLAVLYRNPRRIQLWDSRRWTIVAEHAWDFPSQWKWQTSDPFYQLSLLRRGFFLSSGNEELNIITLHSLQKGPTENLYYLDKNLKEVLIMDISADGMFLAIYARLTNAQSEISCYSVKSGVKFSSILTREVQKLCFLATNQLVTLVSTTYTVYDPFSLCPLHQFSEDSLHTFCFEDGSYIKFKDASPYSMPLPHTIYRLPASSSALETIYSAGIMDTMKSDNVEDMGFSHHCSTNGFCVLSTATNDKKGIDKIYNILRLIRGPTKWLESAGSRKRFLSIGHHTIALFGGSRNRPDLEWVWNAPFRTDDSTFTLELDCIKTIDLETTAGGDQLLHVTLSRESANKYIILELPDAENVTTTQEVAIVHNAVGFLALIARFADLPDRRVPLHETIGLILRYTNLYPDRNLLSVVGDHLPLGDFGRLGLNDILARLIDQEKQGKDSVWIPTHNSHGQSALSAIVLRRNTRSVSAIVNYCLEKALQPIPGQLGYMEIVVSCLPQLIEYHPDVVRTIAMRASYCSVQRGLSKGNQERWIVAHSNRKNFHPLSIEPIASNFSALFTGQFSWWTFTFKDRVEYHQAVLSVLPFPDMFVYPRPNFDPSKGLFDSQYLQYLWTIIFCPRSVFSTIALRKSIFSEPQLMYPIIFYKWEMFAGRIFMLILCLQIIKFILFSVAVISQYQGIYPVIVVITTVFLVQEIRQMAGQSSHYWISFYNFFDLASIGFPLAASILPLRGMAQPPWLNSFSVFFMWLHLVCLKEYLTLAFELPSFPFDNCAVDSCHSFSSTHLHARTKSSSPFASFEALA